MNIKETNLYKKIISKKNIYSAIYSVESYIFEKGLLNKSDLKKLNALTDKFNLNYIDKIIEECELILEEILTSERLFDISVIYKPKKYNKKEDIVEYRPIHTASLITQICIVCLLNQIMFDDALDKRNLSDISKLLPSNFYGNLPSTNVESLFINWKIKYKEYSESFINAYKEYGKTKKYKYEISLDLVNFFPSINPILIYKKIMDKLSTTFFNEERDCLDILIKKLLYFNVINVDDNYYIKYLKESISIKDIKKRNFNYSVGIPQGLPQSYFFANLFMMDISKDFEEKFNGDAYFYVDDSVIYTNFENVDDIDIKKVFLNNLQDLNDIFKLKYAKEEQINFLNLDLFNNFIKYKIEVHTTGKSTIGKIDDKKYGEEYLYFVSKQASTIGFEILSSLDELEDATLKEKILVFQKAVEKEIELVKNQKEIDYLLFNEDNNEKTTNYLKLLKRYLKFFKYRLKVMDLRIENKILEEDIKDFYQKYKINIDSKTLSSEQIEEIFEIFEQDIFIPEAQIILEYLNNDYNKQQIILKNIFEFEKKVSRNIKLKDYFFFTVLKGNLFYNSLKNQKYTTLKLLVDKKVEPYLKVNINKEKQELKSLIANIYKEIVKDKKYSIYFLNYLNIYKDYVDFIYLVSSEYKRMILNSILSKILSISLDDSCNFLRIDSRPLRYYQLRLIMYVRTSYFDFINFISFANKVLNDTDDGICFEKIDFSILEVLPIFKTYIKNPESIDELILTHKYVNSIWKNGSKFLYFYTLHNEEHSVELINKCLDVIKSIDYYQLKHIDYFILFLSCYLHDVSMVLYPDLDYFCDDSVDSDIIYSNWKTEFKNKIKDIETAPKSLVKNFIKEYYEQINNYYENIIRQSHSNKSSIFIKSSKDLSFIDDVVRSFVADISEAHGYYSKDVYGLRSNAKLDIVSVKYLMIILRLADLLDMTKDRVSLNILKQNIKNMPSISKFHWISHAVIEKCDVYSKYNLRVDYTNLKSYLNRDFFTETVYIDIYINIKQLTSIDSNNCRKVRRFMKNDLIEIDILDDDKECKCLGECNFLCKWMAKKNQYLFDELFDLQKYLSRNNNNMFNTKIKVNLIFNESGNIPTEYLDLVRKEID